MTSVGWTEHPLSQSPINHY